MPYGRAWLLRLAIEHRLAFASDALRSIADAVLVSMLERYAKRAPDAASGSYDSDAWALINMHDYAAATRNAAALATVRALVATHFVPLHGAEALSYAPEAGHFMAIATNRAWLVSRVLQPDAFACGRANSSPVVDCRGRWWRRRAGIITA